MVKELVESKESREIGTPLPLDYLDTNLTIEGYNAIPYGFYLYYIREVDLINNPQLSNMFNLTGGAIQNILYVPHLYLEDLYVNSVPYDNDRFNKLDDGKVTDSLNITIFRIKKILRTEKNVGSFNVYGNINRTDYASYLNESKLLMYPYHYVTVNDHYNPPLTILPHLCADPNKVDIAIKFSVSDRCTYSLYAIGYKGDYTGTNEGSVGTGALDLPVLSSAYSQFLATSKSQFLTSNALATQMSSLSLQSNSLARSQANAQIGMNNQMGFFNGAMGLIGGFGIMGRVSSVANSVMSTRQANFGVRQQLQTLSEDRKRINAEKQGIVKDAMAKLNDLHSTPNSVMTQGGDVIFGRINSKNSMTVADYYDITTEYKRMLGDYFTMYGYKLNCRITQPNLFNRYRFNYIKNLETNIFGDKITAEIREKLENIYNNGITFWHVDNSGVRPLDYSEDNKEVY